MSSNLNARLAALPGFPVLAGQCVRLRAPCEHDIEALFALYSHPLVMRYWSSAPMRTRMQSQGKIDEMLQGFERRESIDWLVTARRDDTAIGSCTLYRFDARAGSAEIGYALHPDRWGRGLGAETVALALDWGFRSLGLDRIEADIDPRNAASRRLLAGLGFQDEATTRERSLPDGGTIASELHVLRRGEWEARADNNPGR